MFKKLESWRKKVANFFEESQKLAEQQKETRRQNAEERRKKVAHQKYLKSYEYYKESHAKLLLVDHYGNEFLLEWKEPIIIFFKETFFKDDGGVSFNSSDGYREINLDYNDDDEFVQRQQVFVSKVTRKEDSGIFITGYSFIDKQEREFYVREKEEYQENFNEESHVVWEESIHSAFDFFYGLKDKILEKKKQLQERQDQERAAIRAASGKHYFSADSNTRIKLTQDIVDVLNAYQKKHSQEQLAKDLNVSCNSIQRWIKSIGSGINAESWNKIYAVLGDEINRVAAERIKKETQPQ